MQAERDHSKTRRLAGVFFAALSIFFALNYGLSTLKSRESAPSKADPCRRLDQALKESNIFEPMYATWPWWMAHQYRAEPVAPDVVLIGSSLMNSVAWGPVAHYLKQNLDCVVHRRVEPLEDKLRARLGKDISVFNCSLSGTMASDMFFIGKALLSDRNAPKVAIVGVSPREFIDNTMLGVDTTDAYRFFSRFVPASSYLKLVYPDPYKRAVATLQHEVDSLYLRTLHTYVEQQMHPGSSEKGAPVHQGVMAAIMAQQTDRLVPGRNFIPANFPKLYHDNTYEYVKRYGDLRASSRNYMTQMMFFRKFLSNMQQNGVRVIVVSMPLSMKNQQLLPEDFWKLHHKTLSQCCGRYNAAYVDLTDSTAFPASDFVDTVHVHPTGGYKLIDIFADKIAGDRLACERLGYRQMAATPANLQ